MGGVRLQGEVKVPGDKSITHRAVMFGGLAEGESVVRTTVLGRDNFATIRIMRQLGVTITGEVGASLKQIADEEQLSDFRVSKDEWSTIRVLGKGAGSFAAPAADLDCGNSGTTARLLTGVLSACPFASTLIGDHSLSQRPFRRVTEPLSRMGAKFSGEKLPLTINGGALKGIEFASPQASAQVKSAILLAGLRAEGPVVVTEPRLSRDHTERMLISMGCAVESTQLPDGSWRIALPNTPGRARLKAQEITIPGDFSAAAFFLVAGSIFPGSELTVTGVGMNASRIGLLHVLRRMGASITEKNRRVVGGEEVADLLVQAVQLHGCEVGEEDVVLGIDEIPILCVAAAVAEGTTVVHGAAELRVKENDRLAMSAGILKSFNVELEEFPDGIKVFGNPKQREQSWQPAASPEAWKISGDHRIAMCGAIFELYQSGKFELLDGPAVETSFPGFAECLEGITRGAGAVQVRAQV